jgi:hypothetical protein
VFAQNLVPVREAVAPLGQRLVEQGRVRPFRLDVLVNAVVTMNSVNAEVPFVSWGLVPHTGFEPVISALRGRCPGPLDECGLAAT